MITNLIKDITTGIDGESYDIGRISWIVTTLSLIGGYFTYLYTHPTAAFDILNFGTALATNIGAHGAAIGFKKGTEPNATA
jgi:hypothetical protein